MSLFKLGTVDLTYVKVENKYFNRILFVSIIEYLFLMYIYLFISVIKFEYIRG